MRKRGRNVRLLPLLSLALLVTGGEAIAAAPAGGQESEAALELRLRQAERRLEQGDSVGALLEVEAVLSRDDEFWRAYFVRGRIQARMGDDLGARDSFTRAAELDPGNGQLHFLVASIGMQLADFESAARQLAAAAQAGYDPAAVDALASGLRDYLPQPVDLAAIRARPRVAVTAAADDDAMEALVRELRTLLLEASDVALVQEPERAVLLIRLHRVTGEEAPVVRLEVTDRRGDEPLLERELTGDGLEARVELGDIAAEIARIATR